MHTFQHRAASCVMVVLALNSPGCDGVVHVRGVARNSRGEPISGVKIHVTDMDEYWRTESEVDGCFSGGGITNAMHSSEPLTVEVPGYKTASAKVRTGGVDNKVIVTLAASDSASASQIQLLAPESDKKSIPCKGSK